MRYSLFLLVSWLFLTPTVTNAADANGYTAQYECRAGGPNCNVDVVALGNRACDQSISASAPWSSINWSNNTICLEAGDHTGKGTLTVPTTANGTSTLYKVLRYYRAGDNDDEPWNQTSGNQAKVWRLVVMGDYWLIHRITLSPVTSGTNPNDRVVVDSGGGTATDVIFNRILVEGSGAPSGMIYYGLSQNCTRGSYNNVTLQNSVLRGQYGDLTISDSIAVDSQCVNNMHVVNNEIYDWAAHLIQSGSNTGGSYPGTVQENNDLYFSAAAHTQNGQRMKGEGAISFKQSGTFTSPAQLIHNRIWGIRYTDLSYCCNGSSGSAVGLGAGSGINADWILFKNNIVFDSQQGIEWTMWNYPTGSANHNSVIGNLFYNIRKFLPSGSSAVLWAGAYGVNSSEIYLNTTIASSDSYAAGPFNTNNDFRCNVNIEAGTNLSASGSGTQWDYNVYYATASSGEVNRIDNGLTTRVAGATYAADQIVRTSSSPRTDCITGTESACFLYKVIGAGTTSGSPTYCTTLGCTTTDGTARLQAVRGPYTFKRKLKTVPGGETTAIPYARTHSSAEYLKCPTSLGSRQGIGISDNALF